VIPPEIARLTEGALPAGGAPSFFRLF